MKVALRVAMMSATAIEARRTSPATGMALRQGVVAAQAQQFDRARPLLQQATSEAPDDLVGWYWLAIASESADTAIGCLRKVLAIDPNHVPARDALAKLLVTAARAIAADDADKARVLAGEAAELNPGSPGPWFALAALAANHVERIDALRHLVRLSPDDAKLRTQLRQALLARGVMSARSDRVEARERFREAADLNPADPRVWQALADLAESRTESIQLLRELLNVAPDHLKGRASLRQALGEEAQSLLAGGHADAACTHWREAIAVNGGDVESWLGLAAATSDEEEAAKAIETAYELNPENADAIAAMDRLRGSRVDPSAIAPPEDAFARFAPADGGFAGFELAEDPIDPADSLLDAFAKFAEGSAAPAQPEPSPAQPESQPIASTSARRESSELQRDAPETAVTAAPSVLEEAPAVPETPAVAVPAPPLTAAGASLPEAAARTVMIVDDSPTIRKILGLTLERAGYAVIAEVDGEAALERLTQVIPSVVLLDISMPKLDGYEVCKRIKQDARTANVPVIMLSGKGAFFDKVKGHMAGATEYLTKPFETPAVLAAVNHHCQPASEGAHG
jgi:twitching motility two-component system response regulator PilG